MLGDKLSTHLDFRLTHYPSFASAAVGLRAFLIPASISFCSNSHKKLRWRGGSAMIAPVRVAAMLLRRQIETGREGLLPIAKIRGVNIHYEVIGDRGPWMMASPGGRRSLEGVRYLAERFGKAGFRVLIHDRRNCGVSDVSFDDSASEYEIWADDLYELLEQLGGLPAIVGGGSSGCRMALLFALRHRQAARALLMWRVTGGTFAAARLAESYYGQYITAARQGGMAAVCELDHFSEMCAANPDNRKRLMASDVGHFIKVMDHWRVYFVEGAKLPIIGCTAVDLGSIRIPACIIPGNDLSHPRAVARTAQTMIPGSELFDILGPDLDIDVAPPEQWVEVVDEHVRVVVDFLTRNSIAAG